MDSNPFSPRPMPQEAVPLPLRQPPPRMLGLDQRMLIGLIIAAAVVVSVAIFVFKRGASRDAVQPKRAEATPHLGTIADSMRGLQDNYAKLSPPTLPEPEPEAPQQAPPKTHGSPARPELSDREKAAKKAREGPLFIHAPERPGLGAPGSRTSSAPVVLQPGQEPAAEEPVKEDRPEKERFRERAGRHKDTEVSDRLHALDSPYTILAGTWIPASLEGAINSQLPGHLKARVRGDVRATVDGSILLIPQNAWLIGEYDSRVVYGEDRVLVVWTRLLFPNGSSIQLEGMDGVDMIGTSGLKDKVDNHYGKLLGAVLLSSVLSVGSRIPFGSPGKDQYYQTLPQEFAEAFGQGANQAGQQIVMRQLRVPPTIKIRAGMSLNVFVHKDLVFPGPYRWGNGPAVARGARGN